MRFSVSAVAAYAAIAHAGPVHKPSKTFTVQQVRSGTRYMSGPREVLNTYQKFGVQAPSYVRDAAAAHQSGSVEASPEQNEEAYVCPVTIGSQTLNLDFDTGSSDLWVFSTLQPSSETSGHTLYNPQSGSKIKGASWKITYGDGSGASGVVYNDTVTIGGVVASSQEVEAAKDVSGSFVTNKQTDGLLGLAFPQINTVTPKKASPYFYTVKNTLASPVFTADLRHNEPGSYTFGYIDSSKYTGDITYVKVDSSAGFWGFTADGYSTGSGNSTSGSIGSAIADTGTTLLYIPAAAAKAYYAQVAGAKMNINQGGYTVPCKATLPPFNVEIGGTVFSVPGDLINYAPINKKGKQCFGGIQPNTGIGFSIFGDIFLKSVYAIFDETQSTPRLGFAEQ